MASTTSTQVVLPWCSPTLVGWNPEKHCNAEEKFLAQEKQVYYPPLKLALDIPAAAERDPEGDGSNSRLLNGGDQKWRLQ
jgi:hypothetical protein